MNTACPINLEGVWVLMMLLMGNFHSSLRAAAAFFLLGMGGFFGAGLPRNVRLMLGVVVLVGFDGPAAADAAEL